MKIGFIGVGKLGLPICVGMSFKGHDVMGYDINEKFVNLVNRPHIETRAKDLLFSKETCVDAQTDLLTSSMLEESKCKFTTSLETVIQDADLLFCAVQTPHAIQYEGVSRLPSSRSDFDYTYLIQAVYNIHQTAVSLQKPIILTLISTVLPGSIRKYILPLLTSTFVKLVYNPYFIAMGTVLRDFFYPEFILIGVIDEEAEKCLRNFYKTIINEDVPIHCTTLENAEMIKVSYNTFITAKICLTNTIMLMCDRLPNTDCDNVIQALSLGTRRIISTSYLRGGMGDGGGCHPRDNIAMSWLSNQLGLSFNFHDGLMRCREAQTEYIVNILKEYRQSRPNYVIFLLGKSFKPETDLTIGSPAILLYNMCVEEHKIENLIHWDPFIDSKREFTEPAIYCITTQHRVFGETQYPSESIVIDPFRFVVKQTNPGVIYHGIGAQKKT